MLNRMCISAGTLGCCGWRWSGITECETRKWCSDLRRSQRLCGVRNITAPATRMPRPSRAQARQFLRKTQSPIAPIAYPNITYIPCTVDPSTQPHHASSPSSPSSSCSRAWRKGPRAGGSAISASASSARASAWARESAARSSSRTHGPCVSQLVASAATSSRRRAGAQGSVRSAWSAPTTYDLHAHNNAARVSCWCYLGREGGGGGRT